MKKTLFAVMVALLVAGGGGFWGGMKYAESKSPKGDFNFQGAISASGGQRQFRNGEGPGNFNAGGMANGEILSKDDKSITVKMRDGGSKIIFYSETTQIKKTADGSVGDLVVGEQVIATGTANSDGSVTAQSIQLRPDVPQVFQGAPSPSSK